MLHWGTKSKISACWDEPEDFCSGCNKVFLQEMLPQQRVRPVTSWLGLPQPWSCLSGCKRGWRTPRGHVVLYLPGHDKQAWRDVGQLSAGCLHSGHAERRQMRPGGHPGCGYSRGSSVAGHQLPCRASPLPWNCGPGGVPWSKGDENLLEVNLFILLEKATSLILKLNFFTQA